MIYYGFSCQGLKSLWFLAWILFIWYLLQRLLVSRIFSGRYTHQRWVWCHRHLQAIYCSLLNISAFSHSFFKVLLIPITVLHNAFIDWNFYYISSRSVHVRSQMLGNRCCRCNLTKDEPRFRKNIEIGSGCACVCGVKIITREWRRACLTQF